MTLERHERQKGLNLLGLALTAILTLSGFFVAANNVSATHTVTVSVDKTSVKGGYSGQFVFTIKSDAGSANPIYWIKISAPTGFVISDALVCPPGMAVDSNTATDIICLGDGDPTSGKNILPGTQAVLSFSALAPLIDSNLPWTVQTKDNAYLIITSNPVTKVDASVPVTSNNTPTGWQTVKPQIVNLTCDDGSGSGCEATKYTTDGSDPKSSGTVGNVVSIDQEGEVLIKYYSVDKVGNEEEVKAVMVKVDTTAPVTTDDVQDKWYNGNVEVTLNPKDDSSKVAHTYYTTDGSVPTVASTEYLGKFTVNTEGITQLAYFSVDNAGNVESPVTGRTVKIDKSLPNSTYSIDISDPDGDGGWYITQPTVTLACEDQVNLSGCEGVYYKFDDSSENSYSSSFKVPEGVHTLSYYSKDKAGNKEGVKTTNFKVDITKPSVSDNAPTGWKNSDVSVTLLPQDNSNGSGIKEVKYCVGDNCIPDVVLDSPYALSYSAQGTYKVNYQTSDNASNVSDLKSFTVNIDKTNPVAIITGSASGWVNTDQILAINCNDEGGSACDATKTKYFISSSSLTSCPTDLSSYTLGASATISQHSWACGYVADGAGNFDFTDSPTEFKVDKIAPTGNLTGVPTNWQNTDVTIGLNYSDAGDSDLTTKLFDIVDYGVSCSPFTVYSVAKSATKHSTACWKLVDSAGNFTTGTQEIKIDKQEPGSKLSSPSEHSWQKQNFSLSINDTDSGDSGIAKYFYRVISVKSNSNDEYTVGSSSVWVDRAAPNVNISVGSSGNCKYEGIDKCRVQVKAVDDAGNDNWHSPYNSFSYSIDWTPPVITLNGSSVIELELGQSYVEQGASATDNLDTSLSVVASGQVDTSKVGTYTVSYNVSDDAGNAAITKIRTVNVVAPTLINVSAADVSNQKEDVDFNVTVKAQGNVKDSARNHLVRFYGVIPGLASSEVSFKGASGDVPAVVTDTAERAHAGAAAGDLVLAWGPDGGFPIGALEQDYESLEGKKTTFTANIAKSGTYNIRFVFFDLTGNKQINPASDSMTIGIISDVTDLRMTGNDVTVKQGGNFSTLVTTQGNVKDTEASNLIRFYAIIPDLASDNIAFSGTNLPEVITDASERANVGAQAGDLVIAWGPKGGFPMSDWESQYEGQGLATSFAGTIKTTAAVKEYPVSFAIYNFTKGLKTEAGSMKLGVKDGIVPTLTEVKIVSNNPNNALAKPEDVVTLSLVADEIIQEPTVSIAGHEATVTGSGTIWNAAYTMSDSDLEGHIEFAIDFADVSGNAGEKVNATTDESSVNFDKTGPAVSIVSPVVGDKVSAGNTVSFESNGLLPKCSINNKDWKDCVNGYTTLGELDGFASLPESGFTLYLKDFDEAGNQGMDSESGVIKDNTAPKVIKYSPAMNAVGVNPSVKITATFSEGVALSDVNVEVKKGDVSVPVTVAVSLDNLTVNISPLATLDNNSTYDVKLVQVKDGAGNVMADFSWSFTTAASYSIPLTKGWNLVSLPVVPGNTSINSVLGSNSANIESVWSFDATKPEGQQWFVYHPNGDPNTNSLTNMTAGYGYWVNYKVDAAGSLQGSGNLFLEGNSTPPSRTLKPGWNLIGYYQKPGMENEEPDYALDTLSTVEGFAYWSSLWGYNNSSKNFQSVSLMHPGDGFWISLRADKDQYQYTPANYSSSY